jgi:hypothetical protein
MYAYNFGFKKNTLEIFRQKSKVVTLWCCLGIRVNPELGPEGSIAIRGRNFSGQVNP